MTTGQPEEESAALAFSWFYVEGQEENWDVLKDKPISLTVKLSYTLTGSTSAPDGDFFTAVDLYGSGFPEYQLRLVQLDTPGTLSKTELFTVNEVLPGVPLTLEDLYPGYFAEDPGIGLHTFASGNAQASGTVEILQMKLDFVDLPA